MKTGTDFGINETVISALSQENITWRREPDDRRRKQRIPLAARVRYQLLGENVDRREGKGRSINISSCGILFTTRRDLNPGDRLAVYVEWPLKQDGGRQMELAALARVVRREDRKAAVEILQYEFREAED